MPRATAAWSLLVVAVCLLAPHTAQAQEGIFAGMQKGIELTASSVSTLTTFASGQVVRTETKNLYPALRLNVDTLLFPALRLNAGGVFEVNLLSTNIDGTNVDSTITRNRPFLLLRSTSPVFSPGFGYFRREDRSRTAGLSDVKLVNDEYAGYLGWNPEGGPRSDFQLLRTHTFDPSRTFQDTTRQFGNLISNYTYRNLGAYYQGSYLKTSNGLTGLDTRQLIHAARLSDAGALFRKRLTWDATYNINYQDVTASASSGGEVDVPVSTFSGLSSVSDTPTISRLSQNSALIDGNLTAGAGINIGLVSPPADTQARNIGVDFLNPAEVNRLLIWVDRDLPREVASSFSWEIYSSTDNITWRRDTTASAAPFGPFENRFELVFSRITARYLKVVTRTLTLTVPEASRYTEILVTEIQPFLRRAAGDKPDRITRTTHLINSDVRMRLLDAPALFYEGFFLYNGPSGFGSSTRTLSNGVSVSHAFGRMLSVLGRAAREQGTEPRGDRVATITNATLTIDPIPAFRSSLLYTGQDERVAGVPNDRQGFFIQNAAQVYRGVDVLFGIGWNVSSRETGEVAHDRIMNATATIVPRQHLSFTLNYDDTSSRRTGMFLGEPRLRLRRFYGAVAVDPLRTLHLVVGEELLQITSQQTRTTLDVGANWAPFPDGALQFIFAHNEALRTLEFGTEKSTLGVVRWNVSRRSYMDFSYQKTRSEFVFQTTASRLFSLTLRLFV